MDALAKLQALYTKRDELNNQIQQIADLLGVTKEEPAEPKEKKERKKRGPNKPKQVDETKQLPPTILRPPVL